MDWLSPLRSLFDIALPFLERVPAVMGILGFILVFFLPGFAWTLVFFKGRQLSIIERVAISFGLSIAVVTLSILVFNVLIGVRINGFNSLMIILVVTIIPLVFYYLGRFVGLRVGTEGQERDNDEGGDG
ncbi:DUF1616 domain-containing protein [Chloroflexota bacterium]